MGRKLGKKKLGKTLVADGWQGRVSGAIWKADMETSNYRERSLPPDVLAWPRRGPVLQLVLPEMQQHPSVRQKSGYFGVIAIILIVAVALCWGLTHI